MSTIEFETPGILSYPRFPAVVGQVATGIPPVGILSEEELTVQQAAEVLCVWEPHLDQLLETGEIPSRIVGDTRLVKLKALLEYDKEQVRLRREVLKELAREGQEMGFYD